MPIARQKIEVGLGFPGLGSEEDHEEKKMMQERRKEKRLWVKGQKAASLG